MKIKYNPEFKRWEVYGDKPVIRNKEPQPCYVSTDIESCRLYLMRLGARA